MAGHVVKVSVVADTKQFSRAFRGLANETGLTGLANAGQAAVGVLAKVAAATTVAVGAASVKAVALAADLQQSTGAVEAVFKAAADQMKAYASEAPTAVGLTANAYQELATVLGSQLKNGGTAIDELGGKTHELIGLGADLSAMFGGTTADAVGALSSALKGERDPIERYGVTLKQAMIDAKATELGFADVSSSAAQQAATLALIMEQTADAHGAFAREGDTLSHQVQVLKARLTDMATQAGTVLLPLATEAVTFVNDQIGPAADKIAAFVNQTIIPALKAAADAFQSDIAPTLAAAADLFTTQILPRLKELGEWITKNGPPIFEGFTRLIQDWGPTLAAAAGVVAAFVAGFAVFNKVKAIISAVKVAWTALSAVLAANPIVLVVAAIAALVAGLVYAYQHSETFRNMVNAGFESMKAAALALWDSLQAAWNTIGVPIATLIISIFQGVASNWDAIWSGIQGVLTGVWQVIQSIVTSAMSFISSYITLITSVIQGDWSGAWNAIKGMFAAIWDGITGVLAGAWNAIKGIITAALAVIVGIWTGAWNAVGSTVTSAFRSITSGITLGIATAISTIAGLPSKILSALGNLGSLLLNAGRSVIQGFIDGITSMIGSVRSTLSDLTSKLTSWKGPEDLDKRLLTPAGTYLIDGLIRGLESRYGAVKASLQGLTGMIGDTTLPDLAVPGLQGGRGWGSAQPQIVVNVHALNANADTGRLIAQALEAHLAINGRRGGIGLL
ncbi:hypothetical protein [Schaalia hyovaginalis]|uniref:phage tail protein n=1 Tax=Schaalia hyovaginalis TaxID=29316 RepID=UPI0026ED0676|nr:hypothetical protein [Schaalia hyovaginalis]MCI6557119.1 hypothetical protein [Schaalia hyovaginalis]